MPDSTPLCRPPLHKKSWGIGPLFGLDLHYALPCHFGVAGHLGGAVLAGQTQGKYFERDSIEYSDIIAPPDVFEEASINHDRRHALFPHLRGKLGVNYLWCNRCANVLIEIGYEASSYINAVGQFRFNDERPLQT